MFQHVAGMIRIDVHLSARPEYKVINPQKGGKVNHRQISMDLLVYLFGYYDYTIMIEVVALMDSKWAIRNRHILKAF